MKITYDKKADAAYIYLGKEYEAVTQWVGNTYPCDPVEVKGMINLDFDIEGKLGGIEIIGASHKLSKELLDSAEIIG